MCRCSVLSILLLGCFGAGHGSSGGGGGDAGLDAAHDGDSALSDAGVAVSPDLGDNCPMGCNLTLCVSTTSASCSNQICVWDERTGIDAYCSQPCDDGRCPDGWTCLPPSDGEGHYCFANPAECGNGVLERGEVCDPGPSVGSPDSGCAVDCLSTISGGSVSLKWDGSPIDVSGTSADNTVTSAIDNGFISMWFRGSDLSLSLRLQESDLEGSFPKAVQGQVSVIYTLESLCFGNPEGGGLGPVISVETWEGGYHIAGSFDGTTAYTRCCSFCVDPDTTTHEITESHFDVFLQT